MGGQTVFSEVLQQLFLLLQLSQEKTVNQRGKNAEFIS